MELVDVETQVRHPYMHHQSRAWWVVPRVMRGTHSLSTLSSERRLQCSFRLCSSRCFCSSESSGKKSFCPLTGILWLRERAANSSDGLKVVKERQHRSAVWCTHDHRQTLRRKTTALLLDFMTEPETKCAGGVWGRLAFKSQNFLCEKRVLLHYVGGFLLEHSKRVINCQLTVFSCLSLENSFK